MSIKGVRKQIFWVNILLALLVACTSLVQPKPAPTDQAAQIPALADVSAPTLPPDKGTLLPITLENPFSKVSFEQGPFDFEFYMYEDSGFGPNPSMPWKYSDIPGVGTHVSWRYHGPVIHDPVRESWGICPDIHPGDTRSGLEDGDNGIREGGVVLPQNIALGSLVQFVFKVETPQGAYGGILSFTLALGSHGLEPAKVAIYGLHQALQATGCVAELQSSFTPQSTSTFAAGAVAGTLPLFTGLYAQEHELEKAPQVEPLTFVPVQGSQEAILSEHQQERSQRFPDNTYIDQGRSAMWAAWKRDRLVARETWDQASGRIGVEVVFGEHTLYSIDLGGPNPVKYLQGLWTYDDHWVLETVSLSQQNNSQGDIKSAWTGQIIQDGVSLNQENGYEESFGFQSLQGKSFYFFRREGKIGFVYDGQEVMPGYSQIPHNECCSSAELNPIHARNMLAFFAQRAGKWYYVEIGVSR